MGQLSSLANLLERGMGYLFSTAGVVALQLEEMAR